MRLVDAQVHVWGADTPARPWPPGGAAAAHRAAPVTAHETLAVLDAAGVHRAVLVPPSWEGDRNDLAWAAAARHPDRLAVMGRIPLTGPAQAEPLARWRDRPGSLGVRLTLHRDPWRTRFRAGGLDWFWTAANAVALPVMVYAPGMSTALGEVARRFPDLRLIVDHLAVPVDARSPEAFAHLTDLIALARHPRVAVKATAMPCHSRLPFPFSDLHTPLERVFDAFGPRRVFWGSDWTRLPCPYRENVELFTEALPFLGAGDLPWVMGDAILEWLDWPAGPPGSAPPAPEGGA
ncbi:amidohydrolase family protein [Streptomyces sp. NPDC048278]|uniref:amidohydrolase family protein n=1 Tax=unclassified Streptomyces TaxID=2593676 RepID=UPI00343C1760